MMTEKEKQNAADALEEYAKVVEKGLNEGIVNAGQAAKMILGATILLTLGHNTPDQVREAARNLDATRGEALSRIQAARTSTEVDGTAAFAKIFGRPPELKRYTE